MSAPMHVPQFFVRQKITMMTNRYDVIPANPDGSEGQLLAFAEQQQLAFKEQVPFFADATRTRAVFGFKASRKTDLNHCHEVTHHRGHPIGYTPPALHPR